MKVLRARTTWAELTAELGSRFGDGQGSLLQRQCVGVASQVTVGGGKTRHARGGVGMVWAQAGFSDGEGPLLQWESVTELAQSAIGAGEVP